MLEITLATKIRKELIEKITSAETQLAELDNIQRRLEIDREKLQLLEELMGVSEPDLGTEKPQAIKRVRDPEELARRGEAVVDCLKRHGAMSLKKLSEKAKLDGELIGYNQVRTALGKLEGKLVELYSDGSWGLLPIDEVKEEEIN